MSVHMHFVLARVKQPLDRSCHVVLLPRGCILFVVDDIKKSLSALYFSPVVSQFSHKKVRFR